MLRSEHSFVVRTILYSVCLCNSSLICCVGKAALRDFDLLNIDNEYFEQMIDTIYQKELQTNKTNTSDTETLFCFVIKL